MKVLSDRSESLCSWAYLFAFLTSEVILKDTNIHFCAPTCVSTSIQVAPGKVGNIIRDSFT